MAELLILHFLATGFVFGLVTHRYRHLFGEGRPDRHRDVVAGPTGRLLWVVVCTFLWPLQLVGGLHGLWRVWSARRSRV